MSYLMTNQSYGRRLTGGGRRKHCVGSGETTTQGAVGVRSKSWIALDTAVAQSCLEVVDESTTRHPYLWNTLRPRDRPLPRWDGIELFAGEPDAALSSGR